MQPLLLCPDQPSFRAAFSFIRVAFPLELPKGAFLNKHWLPTPVPWVVQFVFEIKNVRGVRGKYWHAISRNIHFLSFLIFFFSFYPETTRANAGATVSRWYYILNTQQTQGTRHHWETLFMTLQWSDLTLPNSRERYSYLWTYKFL